MSQRWSFEHFNIDFNCKQWRNIIILINVKIVKWTHLKVRIEMVGDEKIN